MTSLPRLVTAAALVFFALAGLAQAQTPTPTRATKVALAPDCSPKGCRADAARATLLKALWESIVKNPRFEVEKAWANMLTRLEGATSDLQSAASQKLTKAVEQERALWAHWCAAGPGEEDVPGSNDSSNTVVDALVRLQMYGQWCRTFADDKGYVDIGP